jgi:PAS domain S-box-containing protein
MDHELRASASSRRPSYQELLARVARLEQQQEESFAELVESIPDGFVALDHDWRFTYVNRRAAEHVGFSPADLVGRCMWELFPSLLGTEQERAYRGVMAERVPVNIEVKGTLSDRWYRMSIYPAGDGVSVFGTDITERKRAEEELRQSEQRLALAASATGIGIFDSNSLTGDILATEQFGYLVGLRAAAAATTTLSHHYHKDKWAERVHRDDWPGLRAAIDACQSARRPLDAEYRVASHDGTLRWVNARGVFEHDDQGNVTRFLGVLIDITDRKKAEADRNADLAALTRMHTLSRRGVDVGGSAALLQETIDTAVAITQADKGTLQLLERDRLLIVAHHGHEQPFLDHFAAAENVASVCGEATRRGERVMVPDVETSPIFSGTPSLPVMRAAGVRAVQSTPLLTRSGRLLGILTTQWAAPHTPDERSLWRLDLLARQAADLIEQTQADEGLRESEERLRLAQDAGGVGIWEWDVRDQ